MSRRKKGESGIRLYKAEKKNGFDRPYGTGAVLIFARGAAVCFLAVSWWRIFFNVFPADINIVWLAVFLFPLAVLGVMWASLKVWQKGLSVILCVLPAAFIFWRRQTLAAAAVNYLANAYLRVHYEGTEPLLLYSEPEAAAWTLGLLTAMATVPVLLLWSWVLVKNRGKLLTVLLILCPAALAAVEGYFPSAGACWVLIFAAGVYFAVCGGNSGKSVILGASSAFVCIMVLFLASNVAAKPVEAMKTVENGVYRQARTAVKEGVVQKFTDLTGISEKKKEDEEKPQQEKERQEGQKEEEKTDPEAKEAEQAETQVLGEPPGLPEESGTGVFKDGIPQDLKAIASFSPGGGKGIVVRTDERPRGTFYYPEAYGSVYSGSFWRMEALSDAVLDEYYQYPPDLERLRALCSEQDIGSIEDAARFIQKEFKENIVYDYNPGATPADQDFAEYFLFENKKGFCVHFATTAVLMYRILHYPARYAEGYAIPASAFQEQEDGTYAAEVTGQMGHAWCETYEDGWQVREHTLPYTGTDTLAVPPASDSRQKAPAEVKKSTRILLGSLTIAGMILLLTAVFLIQGVVRRKQRMMQCRRYRNGRGVLALYRTLYDTAVFLGMKEAADPLASEAFESLKNYISEISVGDWQWIQDEVWQSMFAQNPPSEEEHEKLYQLVTDATKKVRHDLTGWKKIKYHQIRCLG